MSNTKLSMIDMKAKDVTKINTVLVDKAYLEESILPEDSLHRYPYQPGEQY